jgi:outer membrane protein assembly factor BamB
MHRRSTQTAIVIAASLLFCQAMHGQAPQAGEMRDWPQFRGPGARGISQVKGLPTNWSATQNLRWKTELRGAGSSSPIVVGERVFVTSYSGYGVRGGAGGEMNELKRHILCVDRASGALLWEKVVPAALPESDSVREHGYAASTPASDGERLYVFFGKSGVFAFDLNGRELWRADVGTQVHGWGSGASPVVYKNLVIINACVESESLVALNKKTGKEVWRTRGIKESWSTPVVVPRGRSRAELVIPTLGQLLGIDPQTGRQLWSCATDIQWYVAPTVAEEDGVVYCIGGRSGVVAAAVRLGGMGDVTSTHRLWTGTKGSNVSSPVAHDGYLYWMHDNLGIAYCAEGKTGKIVYEERLPRAGQVYASPVLADGKLYYVARDGRTFVLKAAPRYELLAVNDLSDSSTFDASPAVADGRLYLRSDRFLYCVGGDSR